MARGRGSIWPWWAASEKQVGLSPGDTRPPLRRQLWDGGQEGARPFSREVRPTSISLFGSLYPASSVGVLRWPDTPCPPPDIRPPGVLSPEHCAVGSRVGTTQAAGDSSRQVPQVPDDAEACPEILQASVTHSPSCGTGVSAWGDGGSPALPTPVFRPHPLWPVVLGGCRRSRGTWREMMRGRGLLSLVTLFNWKPPSPRSQANFRWDPTQQQGEQPGLKQSLHLERRPPQVCQYERTPWRGLVDRPLQQERVEHTDLCSQADSGRLVVLRRILKLHHISLRTTLVTSEVSTGDTEGINAFATAICPRT
ncbi:uncharacterized protein LOC144256618 [Urocitellus parryii]